MDYIQEIIDTDADPRIKNWYWMSNPYPTIIVSIIYVYLVKKVGPEFMKNRKPYQLTNIILFYNILQVALSAYVFYKLSVYGWMRFNSLFCEPIDLENTELLDAVWWYYFAKFTEFFDTFFFILRKKFNQVSLLHVLHHGVMPTLSWIGVKYSPGGPGSIFGALNSFIHIIMYSYYMFAAMGPQYQKYLWWKRYLTMFQLIQFTIVIIHSIFMIFSDCSVNKRFSYSLLTVIFIFLVLFSHFYLETYTKKPKIETKKIDDEKPSSSFDSIRDEYKKSK